MAEGIDDNNFLGEQDDIQIPTIQQSFQQFFQMIMPGIVHQPIMWHPDCLKFHVTSYGPTCLNRVLSDTRSLISEEQPGADVFPNDEDCSRLDFLIRGQRDTPYEGGFFHFAVRVPPEYPDRPPRVALLTTGRGTVRFNPNFYENGCVCLSILGTWQGVAWQPGHTLANVLHSLQFRFNEMPWDNEPMFDQSLVPEFKQLYSDFLAYQTLRVAVCDQLDPARSPLPPRMRQRASSHFVRNYQRYVDRCAELSQRLDGNPMMNPYNMTQRNVLFNFKEIGRRIEALLDGAKLDAEVDARASADADADAV